jgi:hypothetical protein
MVEEEEEHETDRSQVLIDDLRVPVGIDAIFARAHASERL